MVLLSLSTIVPAWVWILLAGDRTRQMDELLAQFLAQSGGCYESRLV